MKGRDLSEGVSDSAVMSLRWRRFIQRENGNGTVGFPVSRLPDCSGCSASVGSPREPVAMLAQHGWFTGRAAAVEQGWAEPLQQENNSTLPRERPFLGHGRPAGRCGVTACLLPGRDNDSTCWYKPRPPASHLTPRAVSPATTYSSSRESRLCAVSLLSRPSISAAEERLPTAHISRIKIAFSVEK